LRRKKTREQEKRMSETQKKDSSEKQAWEHIAPEWPPGTVDCRFWVGTELYSDPDEAWSAYEELTETPRKRYAELIAPQRVREAAEAYDGEPHAIAFGFSPGDGWRVTVEHAGHVATHPLVQEDGPDICTAAWAAIQALGGGE